MAKAILCFIGILCVFGAHGWDNEDMEIYDVVEEINQNFYEVLGVAQDATTQEIRRAYRRLSLQLHPDKNKEEGAEEAFRKMVAVYEILKDDNKRQKYNDVLENGLPDWRQPVFYFRKARKIALTELFLFMLVIGTIGQYIVLWAIYFEKRLSLEDFFSSKRRRSTRKKRDGYDPDEQLQEELSALPRPSANQLFPWRLVCLGCHLVVNVPVYAQNLREYMRERRELKLQQEMESDSEEEIEFVRKVKKRQKLNMPEREAGEGDDAVPVTYMQLPDTEDDVSQEIKRGNWTDDELGLLAKAVAKYPGGFPSRWSKIAQFVGRSMDEVIEKSQELRQTGTISVNTAAQGTTGTDNKPASFKKGKAISDDIISTNIEVINSPTQSSNNDNDYQNTKSQDSTKSTESKQSKIPVMKLTKSKDPSKKSQIETNQISQNPPDTSNKITNGVKSQRDVSKPAANSKSDNSKSVNSKSPVNTQSDISNSDQKLTDTTSLPSDNWTQNQQVILEWALKQFPRTCEDRWDQIASHIPGKTKEECIQRFKHLAEMLKQRKKPKSAES